MGILLVELGMRMGGLDPWAGGHGAAMGGPAPWLLCHAALEHFIPFLPEFLSLCPALVYILLASLQR